MTKSIRIYDINSHICNIECSIKAKANTTEAIISFDNLGYGDITAIKFTARGFDAFGNTIQINEEEDFFVILQDICVRKNTRAKRLKAILPENNIRKLDLEESQICYEDGRVVSYSGKKLKEIELEEFEDSADKKALCALKEKFGNEFRFQPIVFEDGWICSCGTYNKIDSGVCNKCGNAKTELIDSTSSEGLKKLIDEYEIKELEHMKEQDEKKKKIGKGIKALLTTTALLIACVLLVLLIKNVITPNIKYHAATKLANEGKYSEAIEAFTSLGDYKDSVEQIENCNYLIAVSLMDHGAYEEAIDVFKALGDYRDSAEQIDNCVYLIKKDEYDYAVSLMNLGKYEEAKDELELLGNFEDAKEKIVQCQDKINESIYNDALSALNDKKYEEAIALFKVADHYKDADTKIDDCYTALLGEEDYSLIKGVTTGDTIFFGQYEQDNDFDNGQEDIEWFVVDKTDTKIFLLSKYAIEFKRVGSGVWEESELREWLNNDFIDSSFSDEEKNKINKSISTQDKDKVFLLSSSEVDKYLIDARRCKATAYADSLTDSYFYKNGDFRIWLLRSTTQIDKNTFDAFIDCVDAKGSLGYTLAREALYVRPAMWIELKD